MNCAQILNYYAKAMNSSPELPLSWRFGVLTWRMIYLSAWCAVLQSFQAHLEKKLVWKNSTYEEICEFFMVHFWIFFFKVSTMKPHALNHAEVSAQKCRLYSHKFKFAKEFSSVFISFSRKQDWNFLEGQLKFSDQLQFTFFLNNRICKWLWLSGTWNSLLMVKDKYLSLLRSLAFVHLGVSKR